MTRTLPLLLCLVFLACGPAPLPVPAPPPPEPAVARFVVENATHDDLAISIDGVVKTLLRRGERWQSPPLRPGRHLVAAEEPELGIRYSHSFRLGEGDSVEWRIPLRTGSLEIRNPTGYTLKIRIGGAPLGVVTPNSVRMFSKVPVGKRRIEVADTGDITLDDRYIIIEEDAPLRLTFAGPSEAAPRRPGPKASPFPVPVGAPAVPEPIPVQRPEPVRGGTIGSRAGGGGEPAREGGASAEPLSDASLRIENRSGMTLDVAVGRFELGQLRAGQVATYDDLPRGNHRARATSAGAPVARVMLTLKPDRPSVWKIGPPESALLRVKNRGGQVITVTLAGQRLGTVPPRGEAEFGGLAPGRKVAVARTPDGEEIGRREFQINPRAEIGWELYYVSNMGRLVVINQTRTAIDVFRGRIRIGEVPLGGRRTFELKPGPAVLQAYPAGGGGAPLARRSVTIGPGPIRWVVGR